MPILCAKPQTDIAKAKNQGGYKHVSSNGRTTQQTMK